MNVQEAKEWLLGNRSTINMVPRDPFETWEARVATADAASVQRAYWVVKADQEFLAADKEAEYRRKRLEVASAIMSGNRNIYPETSVKMADVLMAANASAPIPDGAIP